MVYHDVLTGTDLHNPLGHSDVGAMELTDNVASAYRIEEQNNRIIFQYATTTSAHAFTFGNTTDGPTYVSYIADNSATAYRLLEGANEYLKIDTTDGSEIMYFGNTTADPDWNFVGNGNFEIGSAYVKLKHAVTTANVDTGMVTRRGAALWDYIVWDESADEWICGQTTTEPDPGTADIVISAYTNLHINDLVVEAGGNDPKVMAGTADPSAGAGVAAEEGSIYLRYVSTAGTVWNKTGAADTAWTQLAASAGTSGLDAEYDHGAPGGGRTITADSGAVEIASTGGLHISGAGPFNFDGTDIDLDPTGEFTCDLDAGHKAVFTVADNLVSAFLVQEGSNTYLQVTTTDSGEYITFGNTTTNPEINFPGDGEWNLAGSPGAVGNVITSNGAGSAPTWQAAGGGIADLQEAYDADPQIICDATGALDFQHSVTTATHAVIEITYPASAFTGTPHGVSVDFTGATSFNNAGDIFGFEALGDTNAGAGDTIAYYADANWDVGAQLLSERAIETSGSFGIGEGTFDSLGTNTIAICTGGADALANAGGDENVFIGHDIDGGSDSNDWAVVIGTGAALQSSGDYGIAIGRLALANTEAVALGQYARTAASYAVAIGGASEAGGGGTLGVAVGYSADAGGGGSVALGSYSDVGNTHAYSVAIGGRAATTTQANELMLGNATYPLKHVWRPIDSEYTVYETNDTYTTTSTSTLAAITIAMSNSEQYYLRAKVLMSSSDGAAVYECEIGAWQTSGGTAATLGSANNIVWESAGVSGATCTWTRSGSSLKLDVTAATVNSTDWCYEVEVYKKTGASF